jgi:hypothetical protein
MTGTHNGLMIAIGLMLLASGTPIRGTANRDVEGTESENSNVILGRSPSAINFSARSCYFKTTIP